MFGAAVRLMVGAADNTPFVSSDPLALLLTYGPLGIMAVGFAFGLIVAKPTHDEVIRQRDAEREYTRELEKALREQFIPTLVSAQATMTDAIKSLAEFRGIVLSNPPQRRGHAP